MAAPDAKPKLAFYWAASCGGCEITITELGMRLIDVGDLVDIVFWPPLQRERAHRQPAAAEIKTAGRLRLVRL